MAAVRPTAAELGYSGRLIAIEGIDGSGKTTQVHLLHRWLEAQQLKVYVSTWSSSELVRSAMDRAKKTNLLTPTTFCLIHATDFADRYERYIVPLLKAGYLVLCDRYVFTAFARDVVRGCPPDWVRGIYDFAVMPDLTFFLRAPLEVCMERIQLGRLQIQYFEAGMDLRLSPDPEENFRLYQDRLFEQYLAMSTEFGFYVIDASGPVEAQQDRIRRIVASRIDLSAFRISGNYQL